MPKFRKKPVVIEAFQWIDSKHDCPDWFLKAIEQEYVWLNNPGMHHESVEIRTLEGVMRASKGDWIIKGTIGEIYPCKPTIFEATYEPAE